jgi:hypothetical protein
MAGRKVPSLRGYFEGAKWRSPVLPRGLPTLASASASPGQELYLGRGNRSSTHGKEKVYGSIP